MNKRVGFIGLGIMGTPMARNLIKAGFDVIVYNRTASKAERLAAEGAKRAGSIKELADICPTIITMVTNTPDVESIILGENGVINSIKASSVVIDMSTISPEATRKIASCLEKQGVYMLDAPVSGGEQGAIAGSLSIMVGGDHGVYERCLPVFEAMGKNIIHVGSCGMGQTVKLMNQILVVGNLNAVVEALIFAQSQGVDLGRAIGAVVGGSCRSQEIAASSDQSDTPDVLFSSSRR